MLSSFAEPGDEEFIFTKEQRGYFLCLTEAEGMGHNEL